MLRNDDVAPTKYPKTDAGKKAFIRDVAKAAMLNGLSKQSAMIFTAHAALSSGWGASLYGYNLHGIKGAKASACSVPKGSPAPAGSEWGTPYQCLKAFEYVDNQRVDVRHPFRIYKSLADSAKHSLSLQKKNYTNAYNLLMAGDVGYFKALKHGNGGRGWYTASEQEVHNGCMQRLGVIQEELKDWSGPSTIEKIAGQKTLIAVLAASALAVYFGLVKL